MIHLRPQTGASIACVPKEDQGTYMKFWLLANGYFPTLSNGRKFGVEVVGLSCGSVSSVSPQHSKRATTT